jgi:hypothetical protein
VGFRLGGARPEALNFSRSLMACCIKLDVIIDKHEVEMRKFFKPFERILSFEKNLCSSSLFLAFGSAYRLSEAGQPVPNEFSNRRLQRPLGDSQCSPFNGGI